MACPTYGRPAVPILTPLTIEPSDRRDNDGAKETFDGTIRVIHFDYIVDASAYYRKNLSSNLWDQHITHYTSSGLLYRTCVSAWTPYNCSQHTSPYLNGTSFDTRESAVWWSQTCAGFRISGTDSDFIYARDGVNFPINVSPGESILNPIQGCLKGLIPI